MRKFSFIIAILLQLNFLFAVLQVNISTSAIDLGVLHLEEGFHGAAAGNIDMQVQKDGIPNVYVYAHLNSLLTNPEGFTIPEGILRWKGYWASIDGTPNNGASFFRNDWTPYKLYSDDPFAVIQSTSIVSITLGTQIVRIPAVQPQGNYSTRITFTIVE